MDSGMSQYAPVDGGAHGMTAGSSSAASRGLRIFFGVFGCMAVLLFITFVMSAVNAASNASRETREQSLMQRLAVLSGLASESTHRFHFSTIYDDTTRRQLPPADYFDALDAGHSLTILKGWVDMLWSVPAPSAVDASDSGAIGYNVSLLNYTQSLVTAIEVVVIAFARDDKAVEKGSILLCGPGSWACATLEHQHVYTGSGIISSGFARRMGPMDDLHMEFFLRLYGAANATVPLSAADVIFVTDMQR